MKTEYYHFIHKIPIKSSPNLVKLFFGGIFSCTQFFYPEDTADTENTESTENTDKTEKKEEIINGLTLIISQISIANSICVICVIRVKQNFLFPEGLTPPSTLLCRSPSFLVIIIYYQIKNPLYHNHPVHPLSIIK